MLSFKLRLLNISDSRKNRIIRSYLRLLLKHQYQRDAVHTEEQAEQFEAAVEYYLDIFSCDQDTESFC